MERALLSLFGREHRAEVYRRLATDAGLQLSPRACWLMYRIADFAPLSVPDLAQLLGIGTAELHERKTELQADGYVTIAVAPDGRRRTWCSPRPAARRPTASRRRGKRGSAADGGLAARPEPGAARLIGKITRNLVATDRPPDRSPPPPAPPPPASNRSARRRPPDPPGGRGPVQPTEE